MASARPFFRPTAIAVTLIVLAGAFARVAPAQETDRSLFAAARALEQRARPPLGDPDAPAETSLDDIHAAVAAYLVVPKRFPASGYSDDALWRAGVLSLDAFARFGNSGDRDAGQRLLKRLATGYPASRFAKLVPATLEGIAPPTSSPALSVPSASTAAGAPPSPQGAAQSVSTPPSAADPGIGAAGH